MRELGVMLNLLLRPDRIAVLTFLTGLGYKGFKVIRKQINDYQDKVIETLDNRLDSVEQASNNAEKEILRLQILQGIDAERLSYSEVLYFFDKYKALGGNSFVETKVENYISKINDRRRVNDTERDRYYNDSGIPDPNYGQTIRLVRSEDTQSEINKSNGAG